MVTYLQQALAWAGWASGWAPAHPYTLVPKGACFWPAGSAVWPASIELPRDLTFSLGMQFLSMPTPVALPEDLDFRPSSQCLRWRLHGRTYHCSERKALASKLGMGTNACSCQGSGTKYDSVRSRKGACGPYYEPTPDLSAGDCQMTIFARTSGIQVVCFGLDSLKCSPQDSPKGVWAGCAWGLQGSVSVSLRLHECAM